MTADQEITIADIDEALGYLRDKVEDRYGNRLKYNQKALYWEQIDSLLDLRLEMKNGLHGGVSS